MFDFLNVALGWVMKICCQISFNNYILALFFFALIMQIVLFPLGIKQQKSSVLMAKIRPKEMAIRNKYKGRTDRVTQQKMNVEIQDLYKAEGYSAFAGCLPLLIQLPIIFSLFAVVRAPLTYTTNLNKSDDTGIKLEQFYDRAEDILNAQIVLLDASPNSADLADEKSKLEASLAGLKGKTDKEFYLTKVLYFTVDEFAALQEKDATLIPAPLSETVSVKRDEVKQLDELKGADYLERLNYKKSFDEAYKSAKAGQLNFDDLLKAKGIDSIKELPNFNIVGKLTALDTPDISNINWLILIPILIFVSSYYSGVITKKLTTQPANAQGNPATGGAFMTWGMPLISMFFSFNFPAAVGIYWIFRSITGVGQQFVLSKLYPAPVFSKEELEKAANEVKKAKKRKKVVTIEVDEDDTTYDELAISEERAEKLRRRRERQLAERNGGSESEDSDNDGSEEKGNIIEKSPMKDDDKNGKKD